jgi:hypothetical protein
MEKPSLISINMKTGPRKYGNEQTKVENGTGQNGNFSIRFQRYLCAVFSDVPCESQAVIWLLWPLQDSSEAWPSGLQIGVATIFIYTHGFSRLPAKVVSR